MLNGDMYLDSFLKLLQSWPPEVLWLILLVAAFLSVLGMLRAFGEAGLYVYIAIATLAANVQVLKPVQFLFYDAPIPLGTLLFATTYLCTDILNEYFGPRSARRGVLLGFAGFLLWTLLMLLTIGFQPLGTTESGAFDAHDAIATVFTPAPVFFLAGMTAYLVSQFTDVLLYQLIRKRTGGRFLWLRNNLSTALSALLDNAVFSILAWIVLAEQPLDWRTVVVTYIFGTYLIRLAVAVLDTPVIYAAKWCVGKEK